MTVSYLLCECPKLANKEYKQRNNRVASALHWGLCAENKLECGEKLFNDTPENVVENEDVDSMGCKDTDRQMA